jgi:hypothetical protein
VEPAASTEPRNQQRRAAYVAVVIAVAAALTLALALRGHHHDSSPAGSSAARGPTGGAAAATSSTGRPGANGATGASGAGGATGAGGQQSTGANGSGAGGTSGSAPSTVPGPGSGSTPANGGTQAPPTPPSTVFVAPTVPPSIQQAYDQAYANECTSIWSNAGSDGILVDADGTEQRQLTLDDCMSGIDTTQAFYDSDVADALHDGNEDAYWNLDNLMEGMRLQNTSGTRSWTSPLATPVK